MHRKAAIHNAVTRRGSVLVFIKKIDENRDQDRFQYGENKAYYIGIDSQLHTFEHGDNSGNGDNTGTGENSGTGNNNSAGWNAGSNNNAATKEDALSTEKEYPKAGLNKMLSLGVIAIVVLIIMYRKNQKYRDIK